VIIMVVRIRRPARGATFIHPIDPAPRTAILAPGFLETARARIFPEGWCERARKFNPASIAGPLPLLRRLARDTWSFDQAVVVFTYPGAAGLSPLDRESLWNAFGVPVFEQYLSHRNRLLAMECDAHSGLHVVSGCEGMPIERDACPCGNPAPRLIRRSRIEELAGLLA
jgi:hypothetical protein